MMKVTNISPCLKVTKENNMSGIDMYIEFGERIKIINDEDETFIGKLLFIELSKYEEEDDMLYLLLDDGRQTSIGISYIKNIDIIR